MTMTYSESAEGFKITRQRAIRELADHGITGSEDIAGFYADVRPDGDGLYDASMVLAWLGY